MSINFVTTEVKDDDYDHQFKLVLCGSEGSGKSQLKSRLANNEFKHESESTIGVEFGSKLFEITQLDANEKKVRLRLQMWDPGGNPSFAAMQRAYYLGANLLVYCADVTKDTWKTDAPIWFQSDAVQKAKNAGATIVFVATKSDLSTSEGNAEEMREFAKQCEAPFFLTSSSSDKWGKSRATLRDGLQKGLGEALAEIALKKALEKEARGKKAQEEIIRQIVSSMSKEQSSTPINSLSATGFGLFLLVCSGLTFLPGGPSATGTLILALAGTTFLTFGIIGLSINKWLSNLWNNPSKKAAWAITITALVLGAVLLVGFSLSFGSMPLQQILSDRFSDSLGLKFIQATLLVSGFFLCLGLGVCAYQYLSKSKEVQNCFDAASSGSCSPNHLPPPPATASVPSPPHEPQMRVRVGASNQNHCTPGQT